MIKTLEKKTLIHILLFRKMTEEFDEDSADYPLVTPGKISSIFIYFNNIIFTSTYVVKYLIQSRPVLEEIQIQLL